MIEIIALRHGITDWNQQKRIQGHTDIPLSKAGRELLKQYRIPAAWRDIRWFSSPLTRAIETGAQLNLELSVEPLLIEMNWGEWEGKTLQQLAQIDAVFFNRMQDLGLDMQPPNGETPRMVQALVNDWATGLNAAAPETTIGIICHKGVIRAMMALATGWDMLGKPPLKLDFQAAQRFHCYPEQQRWELAQANISLLSSHQG